MSSNDSDYWTPETLSRASEQVRHAMLALATLARCCQHLERAVTLGDPNAPRTLTDLHTRLTETIVIVKAYTEEW